MGNVTYEPRAWKISTIFMAVTYALSKMKNSVKFKNLFSLIITLKQDKPFKNRKTKRVKMLWDANKEFSVVGLKRAEGVGEAL